jgi:glycosyltransferase involved in cell wall biosynthesis
MNDHSFMVLAYKDSPYLSECLESLKNQTSKSDIYICTSTPSNYISDIANKYGVGLFVTEYGNGVVHDNNFGLRQVKTKYVTMAHQDDLYMPEYAETCIAAAEKFKDTLICFTNYSEIMDGNERPVTFMLKVKRSILSAFMPFKSHLSNSFWKTRLLSLGNPIAAPTIMYNLENLPGFQLPEELSHNVNTIDWQIWCNMAKMEGRFFYARKVLLKRRIHSDSLSSAGLENNSRYIEDLNMFRQFWPEFLANILAKVYASAYKSNSDE